MPLAIFDGGKPSTVTLFSGRMVRISDDADMPDLRVGDVVGVRVEEDDGLLPKVVALWKTSGSSNPWRCD